MNEDNQVESVTLASILKVLTTISQEQLPSVTNKLDLLTGRVSVLENENRVKGVQRESVEPIPKTTSSSVYVIDRRNSMLTASEPPQELVSHLIHSDPQISDEDKMRKLSARAWMVCKKLIEQKRDKVIEIFK